MNREKLYYKTVDVLLDAYNANELNRWECEACAVGNICKEASKITGINNAYWAKSLHGGDKYGCTEMESLKLVNKTGYTVDELKEIHKVDQVKHETSSERLEVIYKEKTGIPELMNCLKPE